MAAWSLAFDDEAALAAARRRVRRLLVGFGLVSVTLVLAAGVATIVGVAHAGGVVLACGVLLSAAAGIVLHRLARIHRRWYRFEVSALGIAATDTAGRRAALLWRAVDAVDVSDAGLTVVGHGIGGERLEIHARCAVPRFDAMARHVVAHAHAHRCALSVDGRPVDGLSLDGLAEAPPPTHRGGSAESAG